MTSYVSRRVAGGGSRVSDSSVEAFVGTVLFADIKGFTPLTERLAAEGPAGTETLAGILEDYFGRLIGIVEEGGGDVLTLAGDAVLAVWCGDLSVPRAVSTALRLQRSLTATVELSTRIALATGHLQSRHVGRGTGRSFALVSGPPLERLVEVEHAITAGEVGVCDATRRLLHSSARAEQRGDGVFRILQVEDSPAPTTHEESATDIDVAPYLIETLRERLAAGQAGWVAEIRRMSLMFVHLPADAPLDSGYATVQRIFGQHGLGIYQFQVDDKGTVLIGVSGLPPWTHEQDAVHCVGAALALHRELPGCSFGVATGRVFCGTVGTDRRREFTIVGDAMNLSARLMVASEGGILCDEATCRGSSGRVTWEALTPIPLKGKSGTVPVFRPTGVTARASGGRTRLVGRSRERQLLDDLLDRLGEGSGSLVLVEGDPGLGKSVLLEEMGLRAVERGLSVYRASAIPTGQSTPYHAWRQILETLLPVEKVASLSDRAALLNEVMGWRLPDSVLTASLTGGDRADATRELLLGLFAEAGERHSFLLVLDDVHWFDSASWDLLWSLFRHSRKLQPCCLAIGSRPWRTEPPPVYGALRSHPAAVMLALDPFDQAELQDQLSALLDGARPPQGLVEFVTGRSGGNPFFSGELLRELQQRGALSQGRFEPPAGKVLPETLEGVLTSRIDRLAAGPSLTLKTASVIGRSFSPFLLREVHPIEADRDAVASHLETLRDWSLVHAEETHWIFEHATTQEVAYNLLPFARRRTLHGRVARALEASHQGQLGPWATLLAHHWSQTDSPERARPYRLHAGELALRGGQWREAMSQLTTLREGQSDAHLERLLGEAALGLGDVTASITHFSLAVDLLGLPAPKTFWSFARGIAVQVGLQLLRLFRPVAPALDRAPLQDACRAAERLGQLFFHDHNLPGSLYWTLAGLNWSEQLGPGPELASACGLTVVAAGLGRLPRVADYYARRGLSIARSSGTGSDVGFVSLLVGLERLGYGDPKAASVVLEEATRLFRELQQVRRWEESAATLAGAYRHLGRMEEAVALYSETYASSLTTENLQARAWGLAGILEAGLPHSRRDLLDEAERWSSDERLGRMDRVTLSGVVAQTHLRRGKLDRAADWARITAGLAAGSSATGFISFSGYVGAAETLLECWRHGLARREEVARAFRNLRDFAATFPLARARLWLLRGYDLLYRGDCGGARRAWRRSLRESSRRALRWEEQRARAALETSGPLQAASNSVLE